METTKRKLMCFNIVLIIALIFVCEIHRKQLDQYEELSLDYIVLQHNYDTALERIEDFKELQLSKYDYASMIYNVEAELLEAIERLETGHFTSQLYKESNNTWGAYYEGYMKFDNHAQSTLELARTLRLYYFNEGLDTIEEISKKYCPADYEHWAEQVRSIYESLKGD